jgi:beta-phosphoglucomutase-like phosphatase (HAD superfamily)
MARRSSIDGLPEDARRWLERALTDSNFSGYQALEEMLREQGYVISKSAIHRYGQKIERRFAAIKASTEAARILTEGAADDKDTRSAALVTLIQAELFESIMNLQEAGEEGVNPTERIKLLSSAAKSISEVSRASMQIKKFQQEVNNRVEAAAAAVEKVVKKSGLSDDAADAIRRQILGIAS